MPEISCISIPHIQNPSASTLALVGNTLVCGLAVGYLFGPVFAIGSMVANVALAQLNRENTQSSWFTLNERTIEEIKSQWKNSPHLFKWQCITGIILKVLGISINQLAIEWLKSCLSSPKNLMIAICRICILAPLIEEIVFRGFLQEKIRDVQVYLWGNAAADSTTHKSARIALQAIAFAACHFHPAQGLFNIVILFSTGVLGCVLGSLKESHSSLLNPMLLHAHLNSAVTARVLVFGT